MLVINASNIDKDVGLDEKHTAGDVSGSTIESDRDCALALQGTESRSDFKTSADA